VCGLHFYITYVIPTLCPIPTLPQIYPAENVTPRLVRDELLNCFESANRDFSSLLKQPVTDEALKSQVKTFVESVFSNCGVNFENPTKDGLLLAMMQCKANAEKMMGAQGTQIIEHHYTEMMKLINKLSEYPLPSRSESSDSSGSGLNKPKCFELAHDRVAAFLNRKFLSVEQKARRRRFFVQVLGPC